MSQPPVRYATSVDGVRIAFTIDGAGEPLGVHVGLNAGEPIAEDDDLFGSTARIAACVGGANAWWAILVSNQWPPPCEGTRHLREDTGDPGFPQVSA